MKALVDADGCPVIPIIKKYCEQFDIKVILICDTAHTYNKYSIETIIVDKGSDSADFRLVNMIEKNDIVVTQDYGLAAMCLVKKANVINQNGLIYNSDNIEGLLNLRYTSKKLRNAGVRMKNIPKRTNKQDEEFTKVFIELISNKSDD